MAKFLLYKPFFPSFPPPLLFLVNSTIIRILLELLRRLDVQRQVRLRRKGIVNVILNVRLRVVLVTRDRCQVVQNVRLDVVNENQVHHVGAGPVRGEPAERLEEVRVVVVGNGGVRRVVAVGAEGVGGDVALGLGDGGDGLATDVAGVGVGVGGDFAGGERGEERVYAGVAGREGHGGGGGGVRMGGALPDLSVAVDAVFVLPLVFLLLFLCPRR